MYSSVPYPIDPFSKIISDFVSSILYQKLAWSELSVSATICGIDKD